MRQQQELPALFTPPEVCAALRISRATLYRMVARQDIEVVRLGRGCPPESSNGSSALQA